MNISYQYFNEISLTFSGYDTDYSNGAIIIYLPEDNKLFEVSFEKVKRQLDKIASTLEERDTDVTVIIRGPGKNKTIVFEKTVKSPADGLE
jgi:hypothetical protein